MKTFSKKNVLAFLISVFFLACVFHNIDYAKLEKTVELFNYKILFFVIPIWILNLYFRGLRWKKLIPDGENISPGELTQIYTAGSTLNIFLPARAGDFFRAYFVGKSFNKSKMSLLGSIFVERIFDGITVLLVLLVAMLSYKKSLWLVKIYTLGALFFGTSLIFAIFLVRTNKLDVMFDFFKKYLGQKFHSGIEKIKDATKNFTDGIKVLASAKNTIIAVSLSLLIWFFECLCIYLLVVNFNYHVNFSISLFVISFIALATVIPSSSIYIGPYQYAFILALGMYGIGKSPALAIALVQQSASILMLSVLTAVFFLAKNISIDHIKRGQS